MLDPQLLRNDLDLVVEKLRVKGYQLDHEQFQSLEAERKSLQMQVESLRGKRNSESRNIGKAKAAGEDIQPLLDSVATLGDELKAAEEQLEGIQNSLNDLLAGIPNIPDDSVPPGNDEADNIEQRRWGDATKFSFEAQDHVGLLKGTVAVVVLVAALTLFLPGKSRLLTGSLLAPYVQGAGHYLVQLTPKDLRKKYQEKRDTLVHQLKQQGITREIKKKIDR